MTFDKTSFLLKHTQNGVEGVRGMWPPIPPSPPVKSLPILFFKEIFQSSTQIFFLRFTGFLIGPPKHGPF